MRRTIAILVLTGFFVLTPVGLMAYKLIVLNYPLAGLVPAVSYYTELTMQVDGHGENIRLGAYLPKSDSRFEITGEQSASGPFVLNLESDALNRRATWQGEAIEGTQVVRYAFSARGQHIRYEIDPTLPISGTLPPQLLRYLEPEEGVQVNDPLIAQTLATILPKGTPTMLAALTAIHRHLQDNLANRDFAGYTDALTALKLGEGSCNGKGRLFVAMARYLKIPARLVGGLILNPGTKRVTHQWVEVYVGGHWVPFDTINDHFAEIPENFLTLYYGDKVLFSHTTNVNFQYFFKISRQMVPRREAQHTLEASIFNLSNLYRIFEKVGISQNLLKIILMIPLGALVTVVLRNVVGLETFGTFLPALIAAASRDTGLWWGLAGFMLIIGLTALLRYPLNWLRLLHSPKMAILLTLVVIVMLGITTIAVETGLFGLAHVSLFPIAILAITAERFAIVSEEQGMEKALRITGMTLIAIAAAYAVMNTLFLQSLILAFPELLLLVIAFNLWLGRWIGMRMMEFLRFRNLIFRGP